MKTVFRSLPESEGLFGPCALTIGNFDGVHLGHRTLIRQARQIAASNGWNTGVLTFDPHPAAVIAPERLPKQICSLQQRLRLLEEAGADRILVLPFTAEVARMTPLEFVQLMVVQSLEARAVLVGQNFRFGHNQAGTPAVMAQLAEQFGFEAHFLAPVTWRGQVVSSSAIRQGLAAGKVSHAARLLGRCFSLEGDVVEGRGVGAAQTVPTLNLRPETELIPARGVYVTEAEDLEDGRRWQSITNVGFRPTFGGEDLSVESFLLSGFDGRTPERIRLWFRRWVREERKFPDAPALRAQILRDGARAGTYWRRAGRFLAAPAVK